MNTQPIAAYGQKLTLQLVIEQHGSSTLSAMLDGDVTDARSFARREEYRSRYGASVVGWKTFVIKDSIRRGWGDEPWSVY